MKKDFILILIIGLFTLAYVLDAIVSPLKIRLVTPFHFFTPEIMAQYIFTSVSIAIKGLAIFLSTLWLISFTGVKTLIKGAILILISAFMQLYTIQEVATRSQTLPLEWALSFTLAGVILIIPGLLYLVLGLFKKLHALVLGKDESAHDRGDEDYRNEDSPKPNKNSAFWENKN